MKSLEAAILRVFPWVVGGLAASPLLLVIPEGSDRRAEVLVHLSALVVFSLALAWRLSPVAPSTWFADRGWPPARRVLIVLVTNVVIVTGATALVTLASSAAMQFQPSLQFLQLLSALDIAWVVSGSALAAGLLWGRAAAAAIGTAMSVVCVISIGLYLAEVGLDAEGGWLLDGSALARLVLPFDVAAALITVGLLLLAAQQSANRTG